jgi:hypothetical protein
MSSTWATRSKTHSDRLGISHSSASFLLGRSGRLGPAIGSTAVGLDLFRCPSRLSFSKESMPNGGISKLTPPSYLFGQWRNHGWYHYYLHALAVKEPIGTWILVIWALILVLIRHPAAARRREEAALLLPVGVFLIFVSSQTGFNHHMRYALPIFPFLAVATGKLAYFFNDPQQS